MEKMVMRAFLLAICLDLGHCEKVELFLQQNRNFFSFYRFTEAPISATSNQSLSKGSDTSPCLQPTFCYQVMSVRRVAMIESQMSNGSAAAIFYPQNASLSPVALSYVLQEKTNRHGTLWSYSISGPKLPEGVHQLKEYVIPQDIGQFRLLLFSNDIGRVETVGQIVGPDGPPDLSKLELRTFLNRPNTSRVVYVSGRMETHSFWLTLQFPSRPQFTMVFIPTPKVNYPPSPPVWINWGNLTITETTAAASGAGTTTTACALLYFLAAKAFFS